MAIYLFLSHIYEFALCMCIVNRVPLRFTSLPLSLIQEKCPEHQQGLRPSPLLWAAYNS